jgi:DNA primase
VKETIQNYFKGNYRTFYNKYLPEVKKAGGDEYKAHCPFPNHEDKNASFNFNNQTGQYYCHGCNKKGDAIHFYAKLNNLDTKRDFRKILRGIINDFGIPWQEQKAHIEKTYNYTDAEGQLLYQVVRMNPKDFRQRRPGNNGNWIWNLKEIDPVLYQLPKVLAAKEILIVEGEKDADNLTNLGLIATTCPMGAKKWRPEYNEPLKGKDIVLMPDNDLEGKEHMAQVAISLNGQAKSLKLIELPDLPSKGGCL